MNILATKKCIPCEAGEPSLANDRINEYLPLVPAWKLNQAGHLFKSWKFKNYKQAWDFVNQVSEIAETESHHPNISFTWGKVEIELWTHAVRGLSDNDFILAAKIDSLK